MSNRFTRERYCGGDGLADGKLADDLNDLCVAIGGRDTNGIIDGLIAITPTTPSSQVAGTGATDWNINVTAGNALVDGKYKNHAAEQADFSVHDTTCLVMINQSVYAWLLEKNVNGTVTTVAVKGTPASTGAEEIPSDADIVAALGDTVPFIKLALLHLTRDGTTGLTQTQDVTYRQNHGHVAASSL